MIGFLYGLYKAYKEVKPIYKAYKMKDASLVKALQLSDEVDKLIARYKKSDSTAEVDEIKKDLLDVMLGLEKLMAVSSMPTATKPKDIPEKAVEVLSNLQAGEFARQEMHRIWWAQDAGELPIQLGIDWNRKRANLLRFQKGYLDLAIQMSGLVRSYQRDIDATRDAQSDAREALAEVQKIKDATAAEQVAMLEADYKSFVQQEQEAKAYQRKFQSMEAWATTQHNRFAETIKAGDLLHAKK